MQREIEIIFTEQGAKLDMEILLYKNFKSENVACIDTKYVLNWQDEMIKMLTRFQSNPDHEKLYVLAKKGYEFYNDFFFRFNTSKNKFRTELIKVIKDQRKLSEFKNKRRLSVAFPANISFPIHLMYSKNPDKIVDWYETPIKDLIREFFGMILKIYYRFQFKEYEINQTFLKQDPNCITKIIHAIDGTFDYSKEEKAWEFDPCIPKDKSSFQVFERKRLLQKWFNDEQVPVIIHFSTHLKNDKKYYFTFTKDGRKEKLYVKDIIEAAMESEKDSCEKLPLLFLNTCQSSIATLEKGENFIDALFPRLSLGFISTFFKVGDEIAGEVAYHFYEGFFNDTTKLDIIDSIERSKNIAIDKKFYAALGYSLWQADPEITYYPINYRKNSRKLNVKKNDDGRK